MRIITRAVPHKMRYEYYIGHLIVKLCDWGYEYRNTAQKYLQTPLRKPYKKTAHHWNYPKISEYRKPLGFVKPLYRNLK